MFILFIYRIALLVLRIQTKYLTVLDLLRVLLGTPMNAFPRRLLGFIFVIGFLCSLMWSTDFYSSLLKIKLTQRDIDFDTFKNIDKSGLQIFAHEFTFPVAFNSFNITDSHLKNIKEKIILTDLHGLISCLEKLVNDKDRICIMKLNFKFYKMLVCIFILDCKGKFALRLIIFPYDVDRFSTNRLRLWA